MAQSQKAGQAISTQQTKDVEAIEQKIIAEESRLRDAKANLQLGVAQGAGKAAAQAEKMRVANVNAGIEGVGSTLSAAFSEDIMPLYGKKPSQGANTDFNIPSATAMTSAGLNQQPDVEINLDPSQGYNIFGQ